MKRKNKKKINKCGIYQFFIVASETLHLYINYIYIYINKFNRKHLSYIFVEQKTKKFFLFYLKYSF